MFAFKFPQAVGSYDVHTYVYAYGICYLIELMSELINHIWCVYPVKRDSSTFYNKINLFIISMIDNCV